MSNFGFAYCNMYSPQYQNRYQKLYQSPSYQMTNGNLYTTPYQVPSYFQSPFSDSSSNIFNQADGVFQQVDEFISNVNGGALNNTANNQTNNQDGLGTMPHSSYPPGLNIFNNGDDILNKTQNFIDQSTGGNINNLGLTNTTGLTNKTGLLNQTGLTNTTGITGKTGLFNQGGLTGKTGIFNETGITNKLDDPALNAPPEKPKKKDKKNFFQKIPIIGKLFGG